MCKDASSASGRKQIHTTGAKSATLEHVRGIADVLLKELNDGRDPAAVWQLSAMMKKELAERLSLGPV